MAEQKHLGLLILGVIAVVAVVGLIVLFSQKQTAATEVEALTGQAGSSFCAGLESRCGFAVDQKLNCKQVISKDEVIVDLDKVKLYLSQTGDSYCSPAEMICSGGTVSSVFTKGNEKKLETSPLVCDQTEVIAGGIVPVLIKSGYKHESTVTVVNCCK